MLDTAARPTWPATLGLLVTGLGMGAIFGWLRMRPDLNACVPEFIGLMLAAGILYFAAIYLIERFRPGALALIVILAGAVAFRLAFLPRPPTLSDDVYRYQWEGRVQRAGYNPYTVTPVSPGLGTFQDREHPIETGKTVPTLYPPLSEISFSWIKTIPGYKRLYTALDLASVAILLLLLAATKQSPHRVLVYAWNPAVLTAFSLSGHHDSLAILTLLAALLFIIEQWPRLSIAILGLSFLSKFFPVLLLPAFLKRMRKGYVAIFAGLVVLAYLPFARAGLRLTKGLHDYAAGWEGNDSAFRLLRMAGNSKAQAELIAVVIVLVLVAYTLKRRFDPLRAGLVLFTATLLISPNAFPWYFTWIVPFLCFYPNRPVLLLTVTCALGYAPVVAYSAGQPYIHAPLMTGLEYVPVYLWLAWTAIQKSHGSTATEKARG
ncbi:MAG TPA: glycosyltransferase 87 family protein [Terriglobia bacterium]|nr:glycosyltransferase 87 family protein [Terriglobia bacterium]